MVKRAGKDFIPFLIAEIDRLNFMNTEFKPRFDLSIILPTYNEADNLLVLFQRLQNILQGWDYEIIVMDDNSPDGTWARAHDLARNIPHVRAACLRRGLSAAVIDGVQVAMGEFVVVMDADLQHDETIIPKLIEGLKGARYCNWVSFCRRRLRLRAGRPLAEHDLIFMVHD